MKEFSYKRKAWLFCFIFVFMIAVVGAIFGAGSTQASAATYTTPKYKTYGTTTEGTTTTSGSPTNFTIICTVPARAARERCITTNSSIGAMFTLKSK